MAPADSSDTSPSTPAAWRILDANANRAAEGLRVVEEYLRFVLEDAFWTRWCKTLRHDLGKILQEPPLNQRVYARDAGGDVGATISTPSERLRSDVHGVAGANLRRVAEAIRCLEEYGKIVNATLAEEFERLRFRLYDLERAIFTIRDSQQVFQDRLLYVLIDGDAAPESFESRIQAVIAGGADVIQLRDKRLSDRQLLLRGKIARAATRNRCLFIMNDRADLAVACDADGVHVGQDELPATSARQIVGPKRLVGVSTHSLDQVREAVVAGASYLGCGPTFTTSTKTFASYPGPDFLARVAAEVKLPWFAIGGIEPKHIPELRELGVERIAVSSAVWNANDPEAATRTLRQLLDEPAQSPSLRDV